MSLFKVLKYAWKNPNEVQELINKKNQVVEDFQPLRLCRKHKQEKYQSEYARHNCDYCKLKDELIAKKNGHKGINNER